MCSVGSRRGLGEAISSPSLCQRQGGAALQLQVALLFGLLLPSCVLLLLFVCPYPLATLLSSAHCVFICCHQRSLHSLHLPEACASAEPLYYIARSCRLPRRTAPIRWNHWQPPAGALLAAARAPMARILGHTLRPPTSTACKQQWAQALRWELPGPLPSAALPTGGRYCLQRPWGSSVPSTFFSEGCL